MLKKGGRLGTYFGDVIRAILKRFAAICSDFEAPRHVLSGSRQMDRESIGIYGLWAPASPLKIGIYCDCFGPASIGTIDGIFSLVLTPIRYDGTSVRVPRRSSVES